ncbi:protein of unknown function [Nitratireductor aquimarinus]
MTNSPDFCAAVRPDMPGVQRLLVGSLTLGEVGIGHDSDEDCKSVWDAVKRSAAWRCPFKFW